MGVDFGVGGAAWARQAEAATERAFTGRALEDAAYSTTWAEVLGITSLPPTKAEIDAAYRKQAKSCHPDVGGSEVAMHRLNDARTEAYRFIGA